MPPKNKKSKKKKNVQSQGEKFEKFFCNFLKLFLKECFNSNSFSFIEEPNRQQCGTNQYGRDVNSEWKYNNKSFKWWFECKSHLLGKKNAKHINKKEIADKILDILVKKNPPSCYCIVSREKNLDNWSRDIIDNLNSLKLYKTYFFWWTPYKFDIKKCVSFYPDIWKKIYPRKKNVNEVVGINKNDKKEFFENIKNEFIKINDFGLKTIITTQISEDKDKVQRTTLNEGYKEDFESIKNQLNVIEKYVKPNGQKK